MQAKSAFGMQRAPTGRRSCARRFLTRVNLTDNVRRSGESGCVASWGCAGHERRRTGSAGSCGRAHGRALPRRIPARGCSRQRASVPDAQGACDPRDSGSERQADVAQCARRPVVERPRTDAGARQSPPDHFRAPASRLARRAAVGSGPRRRRRGQRRAGHRSAADPHRFGERPATTRSASARNARDADVSGSATTIGVPRSAPS